MKQEVPTWTVIVAGWAAGVGIIILASGLSLWEGLYAIVLCFLFLLLSAVVAIPALHTSNALLFPVNSPLD